MDPLKIIITLCSLQEVYIETMQSNSIFFSLGI